MWIEFLEVRVNVLLMQEHSCPDPFYSVLIGQHNYFGEGDYLLTKAPIKVNLDYDFFSNVLGKFVKSKQLIDTRWEGFDDYYFSFIGYPIDGYCETFFNVGPYNFFDDEHCAFSTGGLAVAITSDWKKLDKLSWQLQTMELEAIIKEIEKLQQKSHNPAWETLKEESQKHLQTNRQVLEAWDVNGPSPFIPIQF